MTPWLAEGRLSSIHLFAPTFAGVSSQCVEFDAAGHAHVAAVGNGAHRRIVHPARYEVTPAVVELRDERVPWVVELREID